MLQSEETQFGTLFAFLNGPTLFQLKAELNLLKDQCVPKMKLTVPIVQIFFQIW